jgi:alpha-tubulin suppressor-like RCC1 family protein
VAITSRSVLAWGSNEYGQLGLGENAPEQCSRPTPIKALQDIMITQVCGWVDVRCLQLCVVLALRVCAKGEQQVCSCGR